jgi:hypothetical protein
LVVPALEVVPVLAAGRAVEPACDEPAGVAARAPAVAGAVHASVHRAMLTRIAAEERITRE